MNKWHKQFGEYECLSLLDDLNMLRTEGPRSFALGICNNLDIINGGHEYPDGLLGGLFREWPESKGNEAFPVPHPTMGRRGAYMGTTDLWVGEYGDARERLLHWMIEQLEDE